ncbi:MAG: hypothetical protein K9W43_04325 [Candidatus Thorarchaeota archaeon]|nr:hypothetical protein [Candidatus Thorarchaeota archaeon]
MKYVQLAAPKLIAILNWMASNEVIEFKIDTPFSIAPLFEIKISRNKPTAEIIKTVSPEDFTKNAQKYEFKHAKVTEALFSSGVVNPQGWDKLLKKVEEALSRDVYSGEKPCWIAFDTVALNRRYYSILERSIKSKKQLLRTGGARYIITTGIIDEIKKYDRKYRNRDIVDLQKLFSVDWYNFRNFTNQLATKDRIFRLGDVESKKMRASPRCVRITSAVSDDKIINALARHSQQNRIDILAISEDTDFVSKCVNQEIMAVRLDRQQLTNQRFSAHWNDLCDLLYVLAVQMGVIRLRWSKSQWIVIEGIWQGKKGESWDTESLRLSTRNKDDSGWLSRMAIVLNR